MKLGLGLGLTSSRRTGEGGPPPDPGLVVLAQSEGWWEADAPANVLGDGDTTFAQLTDLSGNGNHLVQATSANRPLVGSGAGLTWAEFDGSNDVLSCAGTDALMNNLNAGGTIMFVFRPDTAGEGGLGRVFSKATSGGTEKEVYWNEALGADMRLSFVHGWDTSNGRYDLSSFVTNGLTNRHVISSRLNKTGGDGGLRVSVNGSDFNTSSGLTINGNEAGAITSFTGGTLHLGNNPTGSRSFDGGIYAVAFWGFELSDVQKNAVRDYWATKYSIVI